MTAIDNPPIDRVIVEGVVDQYANGLALFPTAREFTLPRHDLQLLLDTHRATHTRAGSLVDVVVELHSLLYCTPYLPVLIETLARHGFRFPEEQR